MLQLTKNHLLVKNETKLPGKKEVSKCFLCFLILVLLMSISTSLAQDKNGGLIFKKPSMCNITLYWDANSEPDISHYLIKVGTKSGNYTSEYQTPNPGVQIWLPDSLKQDTVFCVVFAVDSAGNDSEPSNEIACIPEVVSLDYFTDADTIINMKDSQKARDLINTFWKYRVWDLYPPAIRDTIPPTVIEVIAVTATKVEVVFSEEVEKASAEISDNYSIDNGVVNISRVELQSDLGRVELTTSDLPEEIHTIIVQNVKDRAVPPNIISPNPQHKTFVWNLVPRLTSVAVLNDQAVLVAFSEDVEQSSAENTVNYSINNAIIVSKAELQSDLRNVKLATTKLSDGIIYSLTVNNIKDRSTPPKTIPPNSRLSFTPNLRPAIDTVYAVSSEEVEVLFSEAVEQVSAENTGNYNIDNGITIINAELTANLYKVKLNTDKLTDGITYTLTVSNIKDRSTPAKTIAPDSRKNFTPNFKPAIDTIYVAKNKAEIVFSEPLELNSAEEISNYSIDNMIIVTKAELFYDLTTKQTKVILSLSNLLDGINYSLTANNIKDKSIPPQIIAPNSQISFKPNFRPAIDTVNAVAATEVEVVFSEAVEQNSAQNLVNYAMDNGITISKAELQSDLNKVKLTTADLTEGVAYTLTVNNVKDRSTPAKTIAPDSRATFKYYRIRNVALGKTAIASSGSGKHAPDKAADGNVETRWASKYSDNQWMQIDMGETFDIEKVVLNWETAYGEKYKIQLSGNGSHWQTAYTQNNGSAGTEIIPLQQQTARYVKMQGIKRGTRWGYSLFEFEVWASASGPPADTTRPSIEKVYADNLTEVNLVFSEPVEEASATLSDNYSIDNGISVISAELASDLKTVKLVTSGLIAENTYTLTVNNVKDRSTPPNTISANTQQSFTAPAAFITTNIAIGKTATTSSGSGQHGPDKAIDGDAGTRWASKYSDHHWMQIDLGKSFLIEKVILKWEAAFGKEYKIQLSDDGAHWQTAFTQNNGIGGIDNIPIQQKTARYVKMKGIKRGTRWGYSLFEFEVYGATADQTEKR